MSNAETRKTLTLPSLHGRPPRNSTYGDEPEPFNYSEAATGWNRAAAQIYAGCREQPKPPVFAHQTAGERAAGKHWDRANKRYVACEGQACEACNS